MLDKTKGNTKLENRVMKHRITILFFILSFFFSLNVEHSAMCRAALGGESNSAQAQAVNDGIVYLMAVPYVLVAGIGYAVYRMRKNKKMG
jgi:hypothetical protein